MALQFIIVKPDALGRKNIEKQFDFLLKYLKKEYVRSQLFLLLLNCSFFYREAFTMQINLYFYHRFAKEMEIIQSN